MNLSGLRLNNLVPWSLILLAISWGIYIYQSGLVITGPFIFGDESTYFCFARSIHQGKNITTYTQYGPLYPAFISLFFYVENIFKTYQWIRILNIGLFLSACIPTYYAAKLLFTNNWLRALLPLCILFTPFSGLVHLIWAEPAYIALFYWTFFLFILFIKEPTLIKSILLSLFLSSLYYTKPGAGLIIQIAAFLTLIIYSAINWRTHSNKIKILNGLTILICLAFNFPWMLHYSHVGVSIIGYPIATEGLAKILAQTGYIATALKILHSAFYQFSYCAIGSWGMLGVSIALFFIRWKQLNSVECTITLFILLSIFGLIALCALGVSSIDGVDYRLPNGRYFTLLLPLITVFTLHLLFKTNSEKTNTTKFLLIAICISTLVTIIATPLYVRSPIAFNSMPDLSPLIYLSDQGHIVWRPTIEKPSPSLKLHVALFFGIFALCMALLRKWRYAPLLAAIIIFSGSVFSAWTEQFYICIEGEANFHDIYRYFDKNHIPSSEIAFDEKFASGNVQFLTPFWMDNKSNYLKIENLTKKTQQNRIKYFVTDSALPLNKMFSVKPYFIYKLSNTT